MKHSFLVKVPLTHESTPAARKHTGLFKSNVVRKYTLASSNYGIKLCVDYFSNLFFKRKRSLFEMNNYEK